MQAVDIMMKPFTNAEKWKFAVALLAHSCGNEKGSKTNPEPLAKSQASRAASATREQSSGEPGAGPKPSRLIVEVCCSPTSKLSYCTRPMSEGCVVYHVTEKYNLFSEDNREEMARKVNQFAKSKRVLFWLSLPCTGGTPWSYVSMKHPTAKIKVMKEIRKFWRLWEAMCSFICLIDREFDIAMEWPTVCRYWKSKKVKKFLEDHFMETYNFHGCMLGTMNRDGIFIKKPWTVATSIPELGNRLSQYQCDGSHNHVAGRGVDLKMTELYTWKFVDEIHSALQPSTAISRLALPCIRSGFDMSIPPYVPASQEDANKVVEEMEAGVRTHVYEHAKYWERKLIELHVGAIATPFEDSTEGVQMLGGSQQPITDLIESTVSTVIQIIPSIRMQKFVISSDLSLLTALL